MIIIMIGVVFKGATTAITDLSTIMLHCMETQ